MKNMHRTHSFLSALVVLTTFVFATLGPTSDCGIADLVDFDALNVPSGSNEVTGTPLANYLAGFGITLANETPGTHVGVKTPPTWDTNVVLETNPNYMSQWWATINGTSFDLVFDQTLEDLEVSIPQITSGVIIPAWSISSIDGNGNVLTTFSGPMESFARPRRTFNFNDSDMRGLRIFSNVNGVAGMGGIPIDDIRFTRAIPEPGTCGVAMLLAGGLLLRRRRRVSI